MTKLPARLRSSLSLCGALLLAASSARGGIIVNIGELVVDLAPGARTTRQLEIANTNDKPAEISVFPAYWKQDENGAAEAVEASAEKPADSAAEWIGVNPQRFVLAKGEKKLVTISIATPKTGTERKECRAMIFTETNDTAKSAAAGSGRELQVHVIGRIGTKVFIRNPQVATKLDCEVAKMEEAAPDGKRSIVIRLRNNGNVVVHSENSSIAFRNAAGSVVETFPLPPFSVLPGQPRVVAFELPAPERSKLEKEKQYNALAVIDYGGSDLVAGELALKY